MAKTNKEAEAKQKTNYYYSIMTIIIWNLMVWSVLKFLYFSMFTLYWIKEIEWILIVKAIEMKSSFKSSRFSFDKYSIELTVEIHWICSVCKAFKFAILFIFIYEKQKKLINNNYNYCVHSKESKLSNFISPTSMNDAQ